MAEGGPLRVLLLEDSAADAELLVYELEQSGLSPDAVRVATRDAYISELTRSPDVILADYTLPDFDAPSALTLLREKGLDIPFLVVTGSIGEERAVRCMREGATDYLLKDRLARLGPAVRRALEEKRQRQEKRAASAAWHERLRFEALFAALSTRLINTSPDALDAAIHDALRTAGESLPFDRVLVMLLDESRTRFLPSYEWCAPGVRSFNLSLTGLAIDEFGWPLRQIRDGQIVVLIRDELPAYAKFAREVMARDGLELLATLPLVIEENVVGCIGFHAKHRPANFPNGALERLKLLSELVANALARKHSEERRQAAFDELARLKQVAERERDYLREEINADARFGDFIGASSALRQVLELVDAVAATKATVLIRGESGVGKELIARAVHARSTRSNGPLVKVSCASIPKELFESEFFGHLKGSFTSAHQHRTGRFELADGGTIFLDEIGELPLQVQMKLLRVLQESEFERVGDDRTRHVDVRVIAATNRNLEADIGEGLFRRDLYYRLNVFPIEVPPLRARREDILPLAEHFLRVSCRELGRPPLGLSDEQRRLLFRYDWPGNVRELVHVIERSVILTRAPPLRLELGHSAAPAGIGSLREPGDILSEIELRALERDNLVAALERADWRVSGSGGAAELIGVHPSTLRDRMKALGIQRPS